MQLAWEMSTVKLVKFIKNKQELAFRYYVHHYLLSMTILIKERWKLFDTPKWIIAVTTDHYKRPLIHHSFYLVQSGDWQQPIQQNLNDSQQFD